MRKFKAAQIILAMFMAMSVFSGCGGESNTPPTANPPAADDPTKTEEPLGDNKNLAGEITVSSWESPVLMSYWIEKFNETYPNIKVTLAEGGRWMGCGAPTMNSYAGSTNISTISITAGAIIATGHNDNGDIRALSDLFAYDQPIFGRQIIIYRFQY